MSTAEETKPPEARSSSEAAPGTTLTDLLPLPTTTQPVSDPDQHETANSLAEEPTLSHSLAMNDHNESEKGIAQMDHDGEVADLGWNEAWDEKKDNAPLVDGLDNEDLWLLIRRFNQQIYHIKEVPNSVPGNLDLNVADEEEFSPDKLRATVERFYMTVIIGALAAIKHVARLRSWRENRRTSCFCIAYFVAWTFDLISVTFLLALIALIVYPPCRDILFPPAPIALVDAHSGGVQKPKAGVLASTDSATGASQHFKGEAVEAEASSFFSGFTSILVTSATGKNPQVTPGDDKIDDSVPDPSHLAAATAEAKNVSAGGSKHNKTKAPMENAIWTKTKPVMHMLNDVADSAERLANALSPTPPFPRDVCRLRLAALVVPLLGLSLFVTSYMFMKTITFSFGFGFFGDPAISRGMKWLNRRYPNWQKLLEVRNTILKGVPTNAQLTLTLLRAGEARGAPLPPPPRTKSAPPDKPTELTDADLRATGAEPPLNATDEELEAAMDHDPRTAHETGDSDIDAAKGSSHGKHGSKLIGFFKNTTKVVSKTAIGADATRAKAGSKQARNRLGALPREKAMSGPVDFQARYLGQKGRVYISTRSTIPAVGFSKNTTEKIGAENREELHPVWSIAIRDIKELKKIGGYGWKAKLVLGWSREREVVDALEITDRAGKVYKVTAVHARDELFNRLVAMGGQMWEAW